MDRSLLLRWDSGNDAAAANGEGGSDAADVGVAPRAARTMAEAIVQHGLSERQRQTEMRG